MARVPLFWNTKIDTAAIGSTIVSFNWSIANQTYRWWVRFFTTLALFVLGTIPSAVWHTDRLRYWLILGNYGSRIPTLSVLINLGLGRLLISSCLTRVSGIVSENKINVPCPRAEYFTAFLRKLITWLILFSMVNSILR